MGDIAAATVVKPGFAAMEVDRLDNRSRSARRLRSAHRYLT